MVYGAQDWGREGRRLLFHRGLSRKEVPTEKLDRQNGALTTCPGRGKREDFGLFLRQAQR